MNIIVIILSILFVLIITIVIFYISKKNVNKTGVSWIFKRPSIECSNQPLKEPNNNKIPYNGIPPSKTMLRMSMKPKSLRQVILNVYGGESLHHPDIVPILEQVRQRYQAYADRWNLTVTTTTNAIVSEKKLEKII